MEYTGEERREGPDDRRHVAKWAIRLWGGLVALGAVMAVLGSGTSGYLLGRRSIPALAMPDHTLALESLSVQMETLTLREPEIRTVVTERLRIDTLRVPYEVALAPEIVRVTDTLRIFQVDTIWMPPQIVTIPVPERTFWSSETYSPSIGNTVWSFGGGILGYVLRGIFESSARACVIVNAAETCNY